MNYIVNREKHERLDLSVLIAYTVSPHLKKALKVYEVYEQFYPKDRGHRPAAQRLARADKEPLLDELEAIKAIPEFAEELKKWKT